MVGDPVGCGGARTGSYCLVPYRYSDQQAIDEYNFVWSWHATDRLRRVEALIEHSQFAEQRLGLVEQALKMIHRIGDGLGRGHIDAGHLEQVDRVGAAAGA